MTSPCFATRQERKWWLRVRDWLIHGHTLHICTDPMPAGREHLTPHRCVGCRRS